MLPADSYEQEVSGSLFYLKQLLLFSDEEQTPQLNAQISRLESILELLTEQEQKEHSSDSNHLK